MVCCMVLLPLVGVARPRRAEKLPVWPPLITASAWPDVLQPLKSPVSKPPLAIPEPPPAGLTVRVIVVEWVAEVPVPVMVTVALPVGVVEAVAMVRVELPPAVTPAGLKLADAPAGRPLALSETDCAAPPVTAVDTVV